MKHIVFDIETIPDVAGLRRLWDLPDDATDAAATTSLIPQLSIWYPGQRLPWFSRSRASTVARAPP